MNTTPVHPLAVRLRSLDHQIQHRDAFITTVYAGGVLAAAMGVWFVFYPLSRIGGVIMMIALAHMISKLREAKREAQSLAQRPQPDDASLEYLKISAQIDLRQSALHNLPFLVGANLFFMGLSPLGDPLAKALQDLLFLGGTVALFTLVYLLNQQLVRTQLMPLQKELEQLAVLNAERSTE